MSFLRISDASMSVSLFSFPLDPSISIYSLPDLAIAEITLPSPFDPVQSGFFSFFLPSNFSFHQFTSNLQASYGLMGKMQRAPLPVLEQRLSSDTFVVMEL